MRTSRNQNATRQVTIREQQERNLHLLAQNNPGSLPPSLIKERRQENIKIETISPSQLYDHYHIGGNNNHFHLFTWLQENATDPAFEVCQVHEV
jgi:hypothetical protein